MDSPARRAVRRLRCVIRFRYEGTPVMRTTAALLALTTATLLPMCGTAFASAPDQISSGHQVLSLMAENDTPTGPGYVFLVQRTGSNTAYLEVSLTSISQSGPNTIESSRMVMTQISSTVLSVAPQYASATVSSVSVPVTSRTCSYPTADVFAERTCTETTDTETFSLAASAISDLNRQAGSYVTDSSSGKTIRA